MRKIFGGFRKLFDDESALGVTGGIIGFIVTWILGLMPCAAICGGANTILGLIPCGISCCQNIIPFGCCCLGNIAPLAPCVWIADTLELIACQSFSAVCGTTFCGIPFCGTLAGIPGAIVGAISGALTEIGGILLAIASGGGGAAGMTSGIAGVTSFFG